MTKSYFFNRARKRDGLIRWALAGFVLATLAVVAAPRMIAAVQKPAVLAANMERFEAPRVVTEVDCSQFDNQAEAQAFLATQRVANHSLDDDKDGIICERLP